MHEVRCPICARQIVFASRCDAPHLPFCSERCRLVDLGRWLDDSYVIYSPADPDIPSDADNNESPSGEERLP